MAIEKKQKPNVPINVNNKFGLNSPENIEYVLGKMNYILLIVGFLTIVLGYVLLSGGKAEDPTVFNPDLYSFRRITLAPIVILIGFIVEIFAIMWKFKKKVE